MSQNVLLSRPITSDLIFERFAQNDEEPHTKLSRKHAVERINLFKKCFRDRDDGCDLFKSLFLLNISVICVSP